MNMLDSLNQYWIQHKKQHCTKKTSKLNKIKWTIQKFKQSLTGIFKRNTAITVLDIVNKIPKISQLQRKHTNTKRPNNNQRDHAKSLCFGLIKTHSVIPVIQDKRIANFNWILFNNETRKNPFHAILAMWLVGGYVYL